MPFSIQSCDVCTLTGSSANACSLGHNHRLARIAIDVLILSIQDAMRAARVESIC